jgi:hypothetical protein
MMVPSRSGPRPLLDQLDAISGVPGGSLPAACYGLCWEKMFGQFVADLCGTTDGPAGRILPYVCLP